MLVYDKNFGVFGQDVLRVTQGYNTKYSHINDGTYAIDLGGRHHANAGVDFFYCPFDEVEVKRVYNKVGSKVPITVWFSFKKAWTPSGFIEEGCFSLTHISIKDLNELNIYVGKKFYRGDIIFSDSNDHIHLETSKEPFSGTGWTLTHKLKWRINNACPPEDIFYIDKDFTKVIETKGLNFKYIEKHECIKCKQLQLKLDKIQEVLNNELDL